MRIKTLTIPEIGFIAGTRAALGAGVALLLADKLSASSRRAVGITLVAIGAVTTIPAALVLFGRRTDLPARVGAPGCMSPSRSAALSPWALTRPAACTSPRFACRAHSKSIIAVIGRILLRRFCWCTNISRVKYTAATAIGVMPTGLSLRYPCSSAARYRRLCDGRSAAGLAGRPQPADSSADGAVVA